MMNTNKTLFTIGYGGRPPGDLVSALTAAGVPTVVDVRLRPDRASMGAFVKAKSNDKGIEKLLSPAGIRYVSLIELGNLYLEFPNWPARYAKLLQVAGDLLVERLNLLELPYALMCAERKPADCHRSQLADFLAAKHGWEIVHIP